MNNMYNQVVTEGDALFRLEQISSCSLGRPYLLGALGEGPCGRFDQNPLYRVDAFDCLTYVNTVLALFFSENWADFPKKIIAINYRDSELAYQNRHHFMHDWNAANAKLGFLQDITQKIVENNQPIFRSSQTFIDRPNWFRRRQLEDIKLPPDIPEAERRQRLEELRAFSEQCIAEQSDLSYLPLDRLFDDRGQAKIALFDQIPSGAIMEVVRPNWDLREKIGTHLNISHLGFIFRQKDQLIFRDASLLKKQVSDTPLIEYLKAYLNHETIKGINLQLPRGLYFSPA